MCQYSERWRGTNVLYRGGAPGQGPSLHSRECWGAGCHCLHSKSWGTLDHHCQYSSRRSGMPVCHWRQRDKPGYHSVSSKRQCGRPGVSPKRQCGEPGLSSKRQCGRPGLSPKRGIPGLSPMRPGLSPKRLCGRPGLSPKMQCGRPRCHSLFSKRQQQEACYDSHYPKWRQAGHGYLYPKR